MLKSPLTSVLKDFRVHSLAFAHLISSWLVWAEFEYTVVQIALP